MKMQNDINISECKKTASKENIKTFLLRLLFLIPWVLGFFIEDMLYDYNIDIFYFLTSTILLFVGIYYIWKFFTEASCPRCGSHKCKFVDDEYLSSEWRDEVKSRNIRDRNGNKIGEYDEGVSVRYSKYLSTYRCCLCKHEFKRIETQRD